LEQKLISFVMSVHLSACISVFPTGQISMKFVTGDFHRNVSRNSRLS